MNYKEKYCGKETFKSFVCLAISMLFYYSRKYIRRCRIFKQLIHVCWFVDCIDVSDAVHETENNTNLRLR